MENMENVAYTLMVMLGEIQNNVVKGDNTISVEEINELCDMATQLNEYFENN